MSAEQNNEHLIEGLRADVWFDQRAKRLPIQKEFVPRPHFLAKDLIGEDDPGSSIQDKRIEPLSSAGVQTSISEVEIIYPWLLQKEGKLNRPLKERVHKIDEKPVLIGTKLHYADGLFSMVISDLRGVEIKKIIPTMNDDEVGSFTLALRNVPTPPFDDEKKLLSAFQLAWSNFHHSEEAFRAMMLKKKNKKNINRLLYQGNEPLFGFEIPNLAYKRSIYFSDEVFEMGNRLAEAWVKECFSDQPMGWEFMLDGNNLTQREVLAVINLGDINLSMIMQFDCITRRGKTKTKVQSQIADLKTGKKIENPESLLEEIRYRQMGLYDFGAKHFASNYLRGWRNLRTDKEIFVMSDHHNSTAHDDRINQVAWRWFDKTTGEMTLEVCQMDKVARVDFTKWLKWYGEKRNQYKPEIAEFLGSGKQFDLQVEI